MPIPGHTFFYTTIGLKYSSELRRLLSIDLSYEIRVMMLILHFWNFGHFWQKNGCGLGPSNPTKKLSHSVKILGQLLVKTIFLNLQERPPLFIGHVASTRRRKNAVMTTVSTMTAKEMTIIIFVYQSNVYYRHVICVVTMAL